VERKSDMGAIDYYVCRSHAAVLDRLRQEMPETALAGFFGDADPAVALEQANMLFYTDHGHDGRVECQRVKL
jgi:hypothetical protein